MVEPTVKDCLFKHLYYKLFIKILTTIDDISDDNYKESQWTSKMCCVLKAFILKGCRSWKDLKRFQKTAEHEFESLPVRHNYENKSESSFFYFL